MADATTPISMPADDRDFLREIAAGCYRLGVPVTETDVHKLCARHGISDAEFEAELLRIGRGGTTCTDRRR